MWAPSHIIYVFRNNEENVGGHFIIILLAIKF